jgi:hypothetical protein
MPVSPLGSDEPIEDGVHDQLDRGRFTARVAKIIRDAGSTDRSAVFGLIGPWGAGKTSLINLVEGQLPEPWKVVRFTPWAASSVYQMAGGSGSSQIGAFQVARFNKVVPPPPDTAEGTAEVEVTDIEMYDLSWANRRKAAVRALQHLDRT